MNSKDDESGGLEGQPDRIEKPLLEEQAWEKARVLGQKRSFPIERFSSRDEERENPAEEGSYVLSV